MKKAKWLIELGLFNDIEEELITTIKNSGRELDTVQYIPFDESSIRDLNDKYTDQCVIFYGSLNLGRKILNNSDIIPGAYLKEKSYNCTSYYPVFGNELLHSSYTMMPYGDLLRRKKELFKLYGDKLFIRPNSVYKQFTGTVLDYNDFEEGVKLAGFYDVSDNLVILVSNVVDIKKEWRFVVVNNKVVSGSLYRDWAKLPDYSKLNNRDTSIVTKNSKSVNEYCTDEKVAKMYSPETVWTIDIASTQEGYKIIEIGCFSCADLYGNNLVNVVEAVSKATEYNYYNQ